MNLNFPVQLFKGKPNLFAAMGNLINDKSEDISQFIEYL